MENKQPKLSNKDLKALIVAAILAVIGILFCISPALGNKALSYIIGTALIIAGVVGVINSFTDKKSLLTTDAILGAAIVAFGMLYAGNELTWLIFNYVPFLLMCIGVVIIVDAIIKKIKFNQTDKFIIELILGVLTLALGICLKFIGVLNEHTSLMLGIVLVVYAVYSFTTVFVRKDQSKDQPEK